MCDILDGGDAVGIVLIDGVPVDAGCGAGDDGEGEQGGDATISADIVCTFSANGPSSDAFTFSKTDGSKVSYSGSKGTATVNGVTYDYCLKVESKTQVSFTTDKDMTITIVLGPESATDIKIDGTTVNATNQIITSHLTAGSHTISRGSKEGHIFYIGLSQ